MKRYDLIGIISLWVLVACTPPVKAPELVEGPSPELAAIDSLMWQRPDSALMRLLPYFDTCTPMEYDRHYAHLLLSELLYKNDYAQTNRAELRQAMAFFDSLVRQAPPLKGGRGDSKHTLSPNDNLFFLTARAHYINGVGYYENDSMVEACKEYLKALKTMEGLFKEKDLVGRKAQFMAYTYNRLGDMFEEQLLSDPAIACYKQALLYCRREPTSKYGVPVLLYNLGIQYDIANQKDSASFYYDVALANMPDYDNIHYRDILASKALLSYDKGLCLDSVIKDLRHIVSLSTDKNERTARLLILGSILFEDMQYDSARLYLETVFEQQEDISSKILAAENLNSIYKMKGDSIKAHQYSSYLANFTMKEIERKADVSSIREMFQNYLAQKQQKEAEKEREKAVKKALSIIIPIAVLIAMVISIALILRNRRLLKKQQEEANKMLGEAEQTHRMEKAAIAGRLKRKNQELRELKDKISQQDELTKRDETAASFTEEPICRLIMERVNEGQFKSKVDYAFYKDYAMEKQQLLDLRVAVDRHYGQFTARLKKAYPELTKGDLDYCCLYLLGLSDADIAALLQKAYTTVSDRSRKINRIVGADDSLYHALHGMLSE